MIEDNQSELIARAEEVLRGLEQEEEDCRLMEAEEEWEVAVLVAEVALMNEMQENGESELAGSARNSALVACATVPLATLVAEQHTCP